MLRPRNAKLDVFKMYNVMAGGRMILIISHKAISINLQACISMILVLLPEMNNIGSALKVMTKSVSVRVTQERGKVFEVGSQ